MGDQNTIRKESRWSCFRLTLFVDTSLARTVAEMFSRITVELFWPRIVLCMIVSPGFLRHCVGFDCFVHDRFARTRGPFRWD